MSLTSVLGCVCCQPIYHPKNTVCKVSLVLLNVGIIVAAVSGVFLLLISYKILPPGVNVLPLGTAGKVIGFGCITLLPLHLIRWALSCIFSRSNSSHGKSDNQKISIDLKLHVPDSQKDFRNSYIEKLNHHFTPLEIEQYESIFTVYIPEGASKSLFLDKEAIDSPWNCAKAPDGQSNMDYLEKIQQNKKASKKSLILIEAQTNKGKNSFKAINMGLTLKVWGIDPDFCDVYLTSLPSTKLKKIS